MTTKPRDAAVSMATWAEDFRLLPDFFEDRVPTTVRAVNDRTRPERRVGRHHDIASLDKKRRRLLRMIRWISTCSTAGWMRAPSQTPAICSS